MNNYSKWLKKSLKKRAVTTHLMEYQNRQLDEIAKKLKIDKTVLWEIAIDDLLKRYYKNELKIGL